MGVQGKALSEDSSDLQQGRKRQLLRVTPLLKSVALSIYLGFGFKWYMINVNRCRFRKKRYFINLTNFPDQLPRVLSNTLKLLKYPNWTTIFTLTTPRSFLTYQAFFPMYSIVRLVTKSGTPLKPEPCRSKFKGRFLIRRKKR
ncbi:uncharacterized protein LOC108034808 [Drosophila biarmipes]|uniref:uncharacterized protein LOC108034808 n=1 Tax=Drosophila biarmipes TaxID=125945 RepID=UPI0007E87296|nr:uncharacterized protein LOC108034808 [Drosophila biarmipes]XP_050741840.1 uncharacterized protein LOC108034808 [Drosophila biarmipes]